VVTLVGQALLPLTEIKIAGQVRTDPVEEEFRLPPGRLGLSEVRNDKQLLIKSKNTLFEGGTLFGRGATLQ